MWITWSSGRPASGQSRTKTRRKGRGPTRFKDAEVVFDGTQLIFPWAEEPPWTRSGAPTGAVAWKSGSSGFSARGVTVQPGLTFSRLVRRRARTGAGTGAQSETDSRRHPRRGESRAHPAPGRLGGPAIGPTLSKCGVLKPNGCWLERTGAGGAGPIDLTQGLHSFFTARYHKTVDGSADEI